MTMLHIVVTFIKARVTLVLLSWGYTSTYLVDHLFMPLVTIVLRLHLIIANVLNLLLSTVHVLLVSLRVQLKRMQASIGLLLAPILLSWILRSQIALSLRTTVLLLELRKNSSTIELRLSLPQIFLIVATSKLDSYILGLEWNRTLDTSTFEVRLNLSILTG